MNNRIIYFSFSLVFSLHCKITKKLFTFILKNDLFFYLDVNYRSAIINIQVVCNCIFITFNKQDAVISLKRCIFALQYEHNITMIL